MSHHARKFTAVLLSVLLLLGALVFSPAAAAADSFPSDALVVIGNKTVTCNMKLNDVKRLFGAPKIKTDSLYGGNICTFYGDNYSNFLYIETNQEQKIVVYATVSDNFRMQNIYAGQAASAGSALYKIDRYNENNESVICGALNRNNRVSALSYTEYRNAFFADIAAGNKRLIPHTVAMFNAASTLFGYQTPLVYDETVYDYVMQLAENGNNPSAYARANSRDGLVYASGYGTCGDSLFNPMTFAKQATHYSYPQSANNAAFCYYLNGSGSLWEYRGAVAPALFLNDEHPVTLTASEQKKLQNAAQRYRDSVNTWNSVTDDYEIEPQVSTLPIEPGKYKTERLQGAVGYINAIRAGAGLGDLTLSNTLTEGAQAKAAYTRYLGHAGISNSNPHCPPKVDGISDAFYQKCQLGSSENLYWGNILTGMMKALDDGYGDPVYCGHRYNLLDPYAKEIGLGAVEEQSAQKLTGGRSSSVDFVCWPSKGVTPTEALYTTTPRWTISAYNGYRFNDNTYVTVKLLNNESKSWKITRSDSNAVFSSSFISFYNSGLALADGYVYQVTLHNVVKTSTNKVTNYTYRSVIASVYNSASTAAAPSLTVEDTQIHLNQSSSYKLFGVLSPRGDSKYIVEWKSSDPSVAEVSPCGLVRTKKGGTAVITASCGGSTAQCTVTVSGALRGDVDKDGNVTITDVTVLQRYLAQMSVPVEVTADTADANADGSVDILDVTTIQRYLAGIIDHLG